ncbi:MarR family transcriptional regulator [Roseomonas nepalensis]|uniref:MarR family transcriptional regulator n=1 Tax=Muricoccus nepalensis TaxID=1854500 RepID=A0A502GFR3_9PROT|nr:MarR family winged helix-turn-helix transcriptional regulator [Roseomonas nepalensis]TPG59543.1 MarR family transcriptional regulator [Roseomonas nepalensis]
MPLSADFVLALRRVTQRWRTRWDAELRESGQTLGRARALMLLSEAGGGVLQRDLAGQLSVEHPTLVRLLDGLERQGLIRREPAPGPSRANLVRLTAEAAPVVDRVNRVSAVLRERVLASVPEEDLRTALRVLRQVADNLDALEAVQPVPATPDEEATA